MLIIRILCSAALLYWGLHQRRNPRKVLEKRFPMTEIPEQTVETTRWVGLILAVAGGISLLYNALYPLTHLHH